MMAMNAQQQNKSSNEKKRGRPLINKNQGIINMIINYNNKLEDVEHMIPTFCDHLSVIVQTFKPIKH